LINSARNGFFSRRPALRSWGVDGYDLTKKAEEMLVGN
jgi:hypothetical protein